MTKRFPLLMITTLVLGIAAGVFLASPTDSPSWIHVSAQAAGLPTPSDRILLKIDNVLGEVTDPDHTADLSIKTFSWGETRDTSLSQKAVLKPFRFTMNVDRAAPLLMKMAAARDPIAYAVLTVRNSLGQDYMKWTISNVFVTSFQIDETAGQGKPTVTFDLAFGKVDVEYRPQLQNGGLGAAVKGGWDTKGQ